jgi:hypothetical protein
VKGEVSMSYKKLNELKNEYMSTPIPENLYSIIEDQIKSSRVKGKKSPKFKRRFSIALASVLTIVVLINVSPIFAETISKVPVLSQLVKLVIVKEYKIKEGNSEANIKVPAIEGLDDKDLEKRINESFISEGKALYDDLSKEINLDQGAYKYVNTDYIIKSETKDRLSIERERLEIQASSYTTKKHYNIDKNKKIVLTLPMLFKNDKYIEAISKNIKDQMKSQMKKDSNKVYFIDQSDNEMDSSFEKIDKNQDFYINDMNQLVISFDEYEVAPGYMGAVEFVIPDSILSGL